MSISLENGESTDLPSTSNDGTGRRPTLQFSIEDTKPREAHAMEKEERQNGNAQEKSRNGSVIDEEFEGDHHVRKPRSRNSSSSYAAPTKASKARKNEKVEMPSYSSSSRQRAFSMLSSLRASPVQRSPSMFKNSRDASPISDYLPQLPWEQKEEDRQTRACSPDPIDSQTVGSHNDEYVAEILHWEQKKQEAKEWPGTGGNGGFEEEELRKQFEELNTERDKTLETLGHLQRELAIAKNEIVNLRQHNSELEARIKENELANTERDERAEIELQIHEKIVMDWRQKHDELSIKTKELEERIEARNRLEPRLLSMEAVEAENKKLLATVAEKQKKLRTTQRELDKIIEYAQERDSEALESDKKLEAFQKFMSDMSEVVTKWAQASSCEQRIELSDMDSLMRSYADDADTKKLLVNTRQLLGHFVQKHEILESRMEDKKYEIESMKKGVEARIGELQEAALQSPGLMSLGSMNSGIFSTGLTTSGPMTPAASTSALQAPVLVTPALMPSGLTRPPISLQNDREGFEGLYEEELEKRKAAEKKIQDISGVRKQQLRLQQARKELESRLEKVLEENEVLRKEAEEAKLQTELWKDESEQSKLELDKRSTEFQACIDKNEQEKDQYIEYYHTEIQNESRWEAANLHKKLEDQEQVYKTLKQEFDRSKATNARKQVEIASLERKCMMQSKHIRDVEQAILHNEELPTLPNLDDEDGSQYGSEADILSPSSTLSPSIHPGSIANHRPKPRYEHPNAATTRMAKVHAYLAQLQARSEEELLDAIFEAPSMTVKKGKAADDIIEKVRKWSLAEYYPPDKKNWTDVRSRSVWERWEGEKWAAKCKEKRFLEILRKRGILEDY
ncbi:hypothetical protein yc1106_01727 [Curvularia clavata]|uniref:Uncharacterized protein n=1 Tax=Curvularia clavata TaxID=95742 RepID=A0A9Q9DNW4_CURCL|nr:hypothetical protein yc1106_01727 [Curvularia clavata]